MLLKLASTVRRRLGEFRDNTVLARPLRKRLPQRRAPLVIAGMFRTASGLGECARRCAEALRVLGYSPICVDLSRLFNQEDYSWADGQLSDMPDNQEGTIILMVNPPEMRAAFKMLRLYRSRQWRIIAAWAWELPTLPDHWRHGFHFASEIWVLSAFSAVGIREQSPVPIHIAPPVVRRLVSNNEYRVEKGISSDRFVGLIMADGRSSFTRKNLFGSLAAFECAQASIPKSLLIIKTRNLNLFPEAAERLKQAARNNPAIMVCDEVMSQEKIAGLINAADFMISLHRAEGFGMHLADAMASGKAVVSTGWSGNMEFMDKRSAALVDYKLIPVVDDYGVYALSDEANWAEPDIADAAQKIVKLYEDRAWRQSLASTAPKAVAHLMEGRQYSTMLGDKNSYQ